VIPLGLKIIYTLFVCALVPVYWRQYGPANFLWFSDIALLAGFGDRRLSLHPIRLLADFPLPGARFAIQSCQGEMRMIV